MTTKIALFALLAMWGVGAGTTLPACAEEDAPMEAQADSQPAERSFTNRVWVKTETGDLPNVVRIFLSDGTMISDSCWETHRLSQWQMTSDTALSWNEDGTEMGAEIVSVSAQQLVLKLALAGGTVEERYVPATVPYVCPDIPA